MENNNVVTSQQCIKSLIKYLCNSNKVNFKITSNLHDLCSANNKINLVLKKTKPKFSIFEKVLFYLIEEDEVTMNVFESEDEKILVIPVTKEMLYKINSKFGIDIFSSKYLKI